MSVNFFLDGEQNQLDPLSTLIAGATHFHHLERLQNDLFSNYSKNIIPQKHKNIPIKIKFDIALNQIIDLVSSSFALDGEQYTQGERSCSFGGWPIGNAAEESDRRMRNSRSDPIAKPSKLCCDQRLKFGFVCFVLRF